VFCRRHIRLNNYKPRFAKIELSSDILYPRQFEPSKTNKLMPMPTTVSILQSLHQQRAWANEKLVEAAATLSPCSS
jgi:hypothetical protein